MTWRDDAKVFTSTDNATFWQGYPGYPVIAVMMRLGLLPYAEDIAVEFAGINWTKLNAEHKRDYASALLHIERERNIDPEAAAAAASIAYTALLEMNLTIKENKNHSFCIFAPFQSKPIVILMKKPSGIGQTINW